MTLNGGVFGDGVCPVALRLGSPPTPEKPTSPASPAGALLLAELRQLGLDGDPDLFGGVGVELALEEPEALVEPPPALDDARHGIECINVRTSATAGETHASTADGARERRHHGHRAG